VHFFANAKLALGPEVSVVGINYAANRYVVSRYAANREG
jgi:hypothetical protein